MSEVTGAKTTTDRGCVYLKTWRGSQQGRPDFLGGVSSIERKTGERPASRGVDGQVGAGQEDWRK